VPGHLLVLIVSESQTELDRDLDETTSISLAHASGVFLLQTAEHVVTSGEFDQYADGRTVAFAQNQVALVVAGDQASQLRRDARRPVPCPVSCLGSRSRLAGGILSLGGCVAGT
jgi:hypothetical protein